MFTAAPWSALLIFLALEVLVVLCFRVGLAALGTVRHRGPGSVRLH